jgi:hypothetical protein
MGRLEVDEPLEMTVMRGHLLLGLFLIAGCGTAADPPRTPIRNLEDVGRLLDAPAASNSRIELQRLEQARAIVDAERTLKLAEIEGTTRAWVRARHIAEQDYPGDKDRAKIAQDDSQVRGMIERLRHDTLTPLDQLLERIESRVAAAKAARQ